MCSGTVSLAVSLVDVLVCALHSSMSRRTIRLPRVAATVAAERAACA